MTNEKRLQNWRQLARATNHILKHPDTPPKLLDRLDGFVDAVTPEETAAEHYSRRLLAYGESLATKPKPPGALRDEDTLGEWFDDFGDALADILADERTPENVNTAVRDLLKELTEWADAVDPQARRLLYTRRLLPGLLDIVSEDDGDTQAAAVEETETAQSKKEPGAILTTEAELLIEIGRLKEQLKEAHNRETAALQAYSELERYHGGGPVQVTFDDGGDDNKPTEAAAAAAV